MTEFNCTVSLVVLNWIDDNFTGYMHDKRIYYRRRIDDIHYSVVLSSENGMVWLYIYDDCVRVKDINISEKLLFACPDFIDNLWLLVACSLGL